MLKNIIIVILFMLFTISMLVHLLNNHTKDETYNGHSRPVEEFVYSAHDPDNDQIKFLIYATEWTNHEWNLTILFKTDNNYVYRFWTMPPNNPNQWMADKLDSLESSQSKLMSLKKIERRETSKIGPRYWIVENE